MMKPVIKVILTLIILSVSLTCDAKKLKTLKVEIPKVELDSALRQFLTDSIFSQRQIDITFIYCTLDFLDKQIEGEPFKFTVCFAIDPIDAIDFDNRSTCPFVGYTVINNILVLTTAAPEGLMKEVEGPKLPYKMVAEDGYDFNGMYFDTGEGMMVIWENGKFRRYTFPLDIIKNLFDFDPLITE